jgi:hypothetical protein
MSEAPESTIEAEPESAEGEPAAPSPAAVAVKAKPKPDKAAELTLQQATDALEKARREAARYREKLREVEPVAQKALEAEEAREARDAEFKAAVERAEAAERRATEQEAALYRMDLAVQYGIPRDDINLIGSGSREEMEAAATRLGALFATSDKTPAPPSNRPVEGLRPGALPEPPKPADNSYPAEWGFTQPRNT